MINFVMIDFEREMAAILADDPLGLLDVKAKAAAKSADERLIESFEEINSYVEAHGRPPEKSRDIQVRRLFSRLQGLREEPEKVEMLLDFDRFGLLRDR